MSFVELVEDISKNVFGSDTAIVFQDASPQQDSCSAISSNMDFETFTGTAESTIQLGFAAPLSWTSDQSTAVGAPLNTAFGALGTPLDNLFTSAISDEEVMSMAFTPAREEAKPEQVQALAELFRNDSLDAPDLSSALGSRDSVYSAPALETRPSGCDEPQQQVAAVEASAHLERSASAAVRLPVSMAMLGRSLSVAAPPQLSRSYSTAGPGTNRPPKDGSQSALLPKDKLNRKRAAARRYYHNQRNKAVDYEVVIARLETENQALSKELVDALKKLEHLKKSEVKPMSVC